ncbi:MAG TPA: hypothetical protein VFC26_01410 [Verrucomicrobiae bacterium]|jgi:hypothetical protein|nr:hypothetical protein [Verrucomicrobiae bacterium]
METISHPFYHYAFGLMVALVALFIFIVYKFRNHAPLLEEAHRRQTADLPPGNYLFLRCSGDEAAALLSAVQFIAWLSMWLAQKLELIFGPVWGTSRPGSRHQFVYVSIFSMFVFWGSTPYTISVFRQILAAWEGQFAVWLVLSALFYCVLAAPFLLLLCAFAAFSIFVAQAVASWSFGWTGLSTGLLVELAIEPLPFGAHSLVHINWVGGSIGLEGIVHSWTYAHPAAIMHLQNWIKESLEKSCPLMTPEPTTKDPS